ncbi:NAD(P)-binding protein [Bacillus sp. FJAT-47783]|uniref:NAD(P)-binding protein n=1 Tax=Bacillus sp. FJAT-47783 TaxID=2922712 RepID=UPI001FAE242B|nr:NAD(P)-binding protein [Bacillus sp. FJAT-47783]
MYYPAMLNLVGKRAVVVGGGKIATRKVKTLLKAEANVTVVSPTVTEELHQLAQLHHIEWKEKTFDPKDIREAFLVIAATNNRNVNEIVFESTTDHQLINIVDDQRRSNFIVPAVFQRGKLMMSISTSGTYPGLAKQIKKELVAHYDERYEGYLSFLESCRMEVLQTIEDESEKQQILKELLKPHYIQLSDEQRREAFIQIMERSRGT